MKSAHRCSFCGKITKNVTLTYDASHVCGSQRYVCVAERACIRRFLRKHPGCLVQLAIANPPRKRRAA